MFDTLSTDWHGKTVFLIGGGPSLCGFDFMRLQALRRSGSIIIAINDAVRRCPFANVVFSIDRVWLARRHATIRAFRGERVAVVDPAHARFLHGIRYFRRSREARLSDDPGVICTGENSGFAALGMAIMRGAAKVFLLGFDMNGPGHFHSGYEWHCPHGVADYPRWASYFDVLAEAARKRGVEVFNCNPESAIRCFPFALADGA